MTVGVRRQEARKGVPDTAGSGERAVPQNCMPVILEPAHRPVWLGEMAGRPATLGTRGGSERQACGRSIGRVNSPWDSWRRLLKRWSGSGE